MIDVIALGVYEQSKSFINNVLQEEILEEIEALATLNCTPNLGSIRIKKLLNHFGSAVKALDAKEDELYHFLGFIPQWKEVNTEAEKVIPFTSDDYPQQLLQLSDHPILLHINGTLNKTDQRSIAIVGTRQPTSYGQQMAHQISKDLAKAGYTIVSGLARGIDTAAHEGALETGRTIAVLGSGLGHIYPPENKKLADRISQNGALISEYSLNTPPDRSHFPRRNGIVSGIALAVLLIEAPEKSGAMLTMQKGLVQNKRLFALPGPANKENYRGNHLLIKNKQAQLVENAEEIITCFGDLFGAI